MPEENDIFCHKLGLKGCIGFAALDNDLCFKLCGKFHYLDFPSLISRIFVLYHELNINISFSLKTERSNGSTTKLSKLYLLLFAALMNDPKTKMCQVAWHIINGSLSHVTFTANRQAYLMLPFTEWHSYLTH